MLELESKGPARIKHHAGTRVLLLPGQWYFGGNGAIVKTLLGSCVAISLWHPKKRLGGMCHFMLPSRPHTPDGHLDGRFGDEAMLLLLNEIKKNHTKTHDYEVHLYGGADTMPDNTNRLNIGERNVGKAWEIIDKHGFQLQCVDVGGNEPRSVTLDISNGQVLLKRGVPIAPRKG